MFGEWVSVNDRMPDLYDYVLVCADNQGTDEPKPIAIARYTNEQTFWEFCNHSSCMNDYGAYIDIEYPISYPSITHWMPLPKLPENSEEEYEKDNTDYSSVRWVNELGQTVD